MPDFFAAAAIASASAKLGCHRLFAPQMLAGLEDGDGHFRMELVGRGQRNDIDLGIVDDGAPVAGRLGKAELARLALGQLLIDLAEMDKPWLGDIGKDGADSTPCNGMALAHETRADKTDADHFPFLHCLKSWWMN